MIDWATIKSLTIPEGKVIKITDALGNEFWALSEEPSGNTSVVLQVQKITSNTYANNTTYNNEEFILLDVYPTTNGTVSVTYGGLTKTIKDTSGAESPAKQQVFFGTFNGVSDSINTPASGELIITGDYYAFGISAYKKQRLGTSRCGCITSINSFGAVTIIEQDMFNNCSSLTSVVIPDSVTSIGDYAFYNCDSLTSVVIPDSVTSIGGYAFYECSSLTSVAIPDSVTSIGKYAFYDCDSLTSVAIPDSVTSIGDHVFNGCSSLTSVVIPDSVTSIGDYAFSGCTSLTKVVIPDSVTSIGDHVFNGCSSLTIYCEAESQPIGWESTWNTDNLSVVWGYTGN